MFDYDAPSVGTVWINLLFFNIYIYTIYAFRLFCCRFIFHTNQINNYWHTKPSIYCTPWKAMASLHSGWLLPNSFQNRLRKSLLFCLLRQKKNCSTLKKTIHLDLELKSSVDDACHLTSSSSSNDLFHARVASSYAYFRGMTAIGKQWYRKRAFQEPT